MHRGKKRRNIRKDVSVRVRLTGYPGHSALSGAGQGRSAGQAGVETLPFRVDLPSRRWLEQAAEAAANHA